ncbi:MAG TPA: isoleucine--tRNA ligase [Actinomycetes bacterium]|nr:isoleucine--tRNA ligase [Actinomycetes bacterium]
MTYRPVPPQVELPALEHDILRLWRDEKIFQRSLDQRVGSPGWVFYEGPPTANGHPGTHHIEARVFKDVFPRYKTMKGYHVPRKAGWDCHGLPVEIAIEKELGFSGKKDIEAFGVAEFNELCRESVLRHVDEFEQMTERMGYWVDTKTAYWTMDPKYVDSLWWALQQIHRRGLLVEDHRVAPYCPRCGTGLSDHELAQGYETVVDPSVYVRFPVRSGPLATENASLLVWTTTPWTLVSNTAVAVHPDVDYVAVRTAAGEVLIIAEPLIEPVLGDEVERLQSYSGAELVGTRYEAPFSLVDVSAGVNDSAASAVHTVLPADYVTVTDGTGLVHLAPAFGPEDLAVGVKHGLPVVNPVLPNGHFRDDVDLVGGIFFKKADEVLVADLAERKVLFRHEGYEHSYPHCWRCHTPLMHYAQPSWYIRTTAIKDDLLRQNELTNWFPSTIKHGRYGDWLNNNIDWALSRNRYWGTPLPIWRCPNNHLTVVGSRAELGELAGQDLSELEPHRPFVDEVTVPCTDCGETAHRVPEVADVWFDSGCMPFAQWGYPYQGVGDFEQQFPADYICEALDQTRGWFYTLMTVGTLLFDRSAYKNVLCLGLLLDKDGRRMSKHLGNTLDPMALMERHGADAVRWFMLASGSPWAPRRVSHQSIQEIVRRVLLTYWNTVSFHVLYAGLADWSPVSGPVPPLGERTMLDRWLSSQSEQLVKDVDEALAEFDSQRAGRVIADFIDELSNWYVRRSRRRFWDGDPAALATLHEALQRLTLVMSPLVPFITEQVWQDVFRPTTPNAPDSVHLADFPQHNDALIDPNLAKQVTQVRRLVELGRAARAESGVKTRQPLQRALVAAAGWEGMPQPLRDQLAEELNVISIDPLETTGDELVQVSAKANFRSLGKRFGKQTPAIAEAVADADAAGLSRQLRANGTTTLSVGNEVVTIEDGDVVFTETPRAGWAVQHQGGESIALDLTLTPELRRVGLARDLIRLVQQSRKTSGFEVSDRIHLTWTAAGEFAEEMATAVAEHQELIASEVLALAVTEDPSLPGNPAAHTDPELGLSFLVTPAG